jgi:hypothetical protein
MEVWSPEEVQAIVDLVKSNPRGFLKLAAKHSNMPIDQVEKSMRAWGIRVPNKNDQTTSNRSARRR